MPKAQWSSPDVWTTDLTPAQLDPAPWDALPTNPDALRARLYQLAHGRGQSPDGEVVVIIADALRSGRIPAPVRQAMFRVLKTVPGIDLGKDDAGESKGVLPSQEWKKQRFKKPEQQKWYAGETISIGIGQGYNAYTPIQLAQATATLANNGVMFRPHLVQNIVDTRNGEKRPVEPKPLRDLGWKQKNLDVIHRAMIGVNKEGTGTRAFAGAPYSVGGKTGTAQVFSLKGAQYKESAVKKHLRDHALFIAYAPVENPKIALAVLVENGGFGAQSAAPIARMVLDYYLLGKLPAGAAKEDSDAIEEEHEE